MSENFLHGLRLPWPVAWGALFGRQAPLLAEIGFGGGDFLLDLARKRPSTNVVGLEISLPSLRKTARKVDRAGLPNVRLIQSDARGFLWALCRPAALHALYANFPDPWPKPGHQHRRLINPDFLALAASRLQPGAPLEIATDHAEYAEVITDCLQQSPYFASQTGAPFLTADPARVQTKYERKALAAGSVCHYFKWRRNETPVPVVFPIPQEISMPHVVLRTPLTTADIQRQFQPWHVSAAGTEIKFIASYASALHADLLVEVYIGEEPVHQRLGLAIRPRPSGDVVIGLHEIGFPRPTAGVHEAVRALLTWLQTLHPRTEVVSSTLADSLASRESVDE
ncbi:MAG: tRNA (guanosine(46)-N7)-methyltransferase TrmB [Anaerolineales bacterium]|nr:tRNA (guanosine(46)-N7)-methyltransferase TrmB [Anaerolineales bacterium]